MNIKEAVERACQEPTLVDALSWIADWEADRAIHQALKQRETGISTAGPDKKWDTCFKVCFERVFASYNPVQTLLNTLGLQNEMNASDTLVLDFYSDPEEIKKVLKRIVNKDNKYCFVHFKKAIEDPEIAASLTFYVLGNKTTYVKTYVMFNTATGKLVESF